MHKDHEAEIRATKRLAGIDYLVFPEYQEALDGFIGGAMSSLVGGSWDERLLGRPLNYQEAAGDVHLNDNLLVAADVWNAFLTYHESAGEISAKVKQK